MSIMKQTLTGITLASFLVISVFGLFLMSTMHGGCIAEAVNGGICPQNAFASLAFHLNAFRTFSSATLSVTSVIILIALLSVSALLFVNKNNRLLLPQHTAYVNTGSQFLPIRETFMNWIALHEKRDPAFSI